MPLPKSEIIAIAKLLKVSDSETSKLLEEQLNSFDTSILRQINNEIPLDDIDTRREFIDLVKRNKRIRLKDDFLTWAKKDISDLEEGVFFLAQFDNPLLDIQHYVSVLNNWAISLNTMLKKIKMKDDATSLINEINHFIFMELGFSGNKENYYDPNNSYIDKVIEKRTGNPISLSMIYLLLTKRISLPFSGVNMPAHFLLQYMDSFDPVYIDPFNQGEIITRDLCLERIKTLKLAWQEDYLSPPSNKQIISRMIQNLVNIYHNDGDFELKECLEGYLKVIKN